MTNYPACDFCGECSCCPRHDCQPCQAISDPVQWLERGLDGLDSYGIVPYQRLDDDPFESFWYANSGSGSTGPMFSLKDDGGGSGAYYLLVYETLETPIDRTTAHP